MKKEFEFEKAIPAEDIVDYLKVLVDAFEKKLVSFNTAEGSFVLKPSGLIHMEVEATSKKEKEKFEIKFSWRKETDVQEEVEKEFSITSEESSITPESDSICESDLPEETTEAALEEVVPEECTEQHEEAEVHKSKKHK